MRFTEREPFAGAVRLLQAGKRGDLDGIRVELNAFEIRRRRSWWTKMLGAVGLATGLPRIARTAIQDALEHAAGEGQNEVVRALLPFADPLANGSHALKKATAGRHLDTVRLLLPLSDSNAGPSGALEIAIANRYADAVTLFLSTENPQTHHSKVLAEAAVFEPLDLVKRLIPQSNAKERARALLFAAREGRADVVQALIPVIDPRLLDPNALGFAAEMGHANVVEILVPLFDAEGLFVSMCEGTGDAKLLEKKKRGAIANGLLPYVSDATAKKVLRTVDPDVLTAMPGLLAMQEALALERAVPDFLSTHPNSPQGSPQQVMRPRRRL